MNVKGDYRLLRQGGGHAAFAHVYVQIMERSKVDAQVIVVIDPADSATVTPDQELELFKAAIEGCEEGLREIQARGLQTDIYQVAITRLLINRVDTREDAVWSSAFLATTAAFGVMDQFQLVFLNEWKVVSQNE